MAINLPYSLLFEEAQTQGFPLCGIYQAPSGALPMEDVQRLKEWQLAGYGGEMAYMARDASERCEATYHEPWAKTVISFAIPYSSHASALEVSTGYGKTGYSKTGYGRVARYAWGRDYHRVLKKKLHLLGETLKKALHSDFHWRAISDSFPLLERAYANRAKLGFVGKNTMLIRPKVGSYFFLAEVLTDLPVVDIPSFKIAGECGTCSRCISACPTGAFESSYKLNAPKCISYLTIEKRGVFTEWESAAVGSWLFGCDICQEVCPFNHGSNKSNSLSVLDEFSPTNGVGSLIELNSIFSIRSDDEFKERFAGTPLMRPGRRGVVRNALSVAVNQNAKACIEPITEMLKCEESEGVSKMAVVSLEKLKKSSF